MPHGCRFSLPLQAQSVFTFLSMPCTGYKCLPEIATAPLGPRNDKLEGLAPQNACRKDCQPARRSLSAATDAIGTCYFIDALYGLQMPSRDCHVGLRPPRNDKPLVSTILTAACTGCKCAAGRGMPLPYILDFTRLTRSSLHTVSTWAQRGKRSTASACVRA